MQALKSNTAVLLWILRHFKNTYSEENLRMAASVMVAISKAMFYTSKLHKQTSDLKYTIVHHRNKVAILDISILSSRENFSFLGGLLLFFLSCQKHLKLQNVNKKTWLLVVSWWKPQIDTTLLEYLAKHLWWNVLWK